MKKIYTRSIPVVAFLGLAAMAGYIQSEKQDRAQYSEPGVVLIPLQQESRNLAETLQWERQFVLRGVPAMEPIAVAQASETGGNGVNGGVGGDGGNGPGAAVGPEGNVPSSSETPPP